MRATRLLQAALATHRRASSMASKHSTSESRPLAIVSCNTSNSAAIAQSLALDSVANRLAEKALSAPWSRDAVRARARLCQIRSHAWSCLRGRRSATVCVFGGKEEEEN